MIHATNSEIETYPARAFRTPSLDAQTGMIQAQARMEDSAFNDTELMWTIGSDIVVFASEMFVGNGEPTGVYAAYQMHVGFILVRKSEF